MKQVLNLRSWVVVGSYAAGIALGARLFGSGAGAGGIAVANGGAGAAGAGPFFGAPGLAGELAFLVLFVVVVLCGVAAVYWFGAKRDPRVVSAYLLIVAVFVVAGGVTGMRIDVAAIKKANNPWAVSGAGQAANNSWVATGSMSRVGIGSDNRTVKAGKDVENNVAKPSTQDGDSKAFEDTKSGAADVKDIGNASPLLGNGIGIVPGLVRAVIGGAQGVVDNTRAYVRRVMEERLPADEAGLMMGILLGDTSTVPPDVKADFKTTGLSHILAVSGLNVTILVAACGFLFTSALAGFDTPGRLTPGRFLVFGVTAAAIVFYMALCGFAPSIVRAGIMGLAALAAPLTGRQTNVFAAMAAAAFVLLIIDPSTVFNIGFQLSFAATISIILFVPHVTRWLTATPDAPSGVAKTFALAISAQIGVAPILAANFGSLSLITPAANAAVESAIMPAQLLGIVIPMLNYISTPLAAIAAYPAHIILAYTMAGTSFFARWPFASIGIPRPAAATTATEITTAVVAGAYFILVTAFYIFLRFREPRTKFTEVFRGRAYTRAIFIAGAAGILIIGMLGYQAYIGLPPKGLKVTFLDVGQGDSTLIQTEDGANILIDGGPEADSAEAQLRARGVQQINLLIITHPHADHVNGLPAVVSGHRVEEAIIPPDKSQNNQYLRTLELLTNNKVAEVAARDGQNFKVGRNLTVKILSPDAPDANKAANGSEAASENANNQAVVALIQYKNIKMLFTGDIEFQTEEDIVADGEAQKVDILKVPHHGSKNGADVALLNILKPKFAIISVGANNRYHHPAPTTIDLLRKVGASIFRTDKNGSVTIESDGKTISASSQR